VLCCHEYIVCCSELLAEEAPRKQSRAHGRVAYVAVAAQVCACCHPCTVCVYQLCVLTSVSLSLSLSLSVCVCVCVLVLPATSKASASAYIHVRVCVHMYVHAAVLLHLQCRAARPSTVSLFAPTAVGGLRSPSFITGFCIALKGDTVPTRLTNVHRG
jgi:hypothetical protein